MEQPSRIRKKLGITELPEQDVQTIENRVSRLNAAAFEGTVFDRPVNQGSNDIRVTADLVDAVVARLLLGDSYHDVKRHPTCKDRNGKSLTLEQIRAIHTALRERHQELNSPDVDAGP